MLPVLLAARPAQTLSSSVNSPRDMLPSRTKALRQRWEGVPDEACLNGVGSAGLCVPSFRSEMDLL